VNVAPLDAVCEACPMLRIRTACAVVLLASCGAACGVTRIESVIASTFDQHIPANAKIFVMVEPPLDVSFERVDTGTPQPLTHEAIGSGTSRSEVIYFVDPGDVSVGDIIEVQATCNPACPERSRATITFDTEDDVTPPELLEGDIEAVVHGVRDNPFSPLIARYEVSLTFGQISDQSPTFVRFRSDELEAVRPTGGLVAFVAVDGGIQRRLCFDADLMDAAGNETPMARDLCVELDPSTAEPWGALPLPET
jgi:hypothetical protein